MSMTLIWFFIGLGFLLAELAFPALVVIFFGAGAWITMAPAALGWSLKAQIIIFIVVSLVSLLLLRRYVKSVFSGHALTPRKEAAHPLTGQQGIVSKELRPGLVGEVSIGGSFWRAVADMPLPEGTAVRVLGTVSGDELILRVESLLPPGR